MQKQSVNQSFITLRLIILRVEIPLFEKRMDFERSSEDGVVYKIKIKKNEKNHLSNHHIGNNNFLQQN